MQKRYGGQSQQIAMVGWLDAERVRNVLVPACSAMGASRGRGPIELRMNIWRCKRKPKRSQQIMKLAAIFGRRLATFPVLQTINRTNNQSIEN